MNATVGLADDTTPLATGENNSRSLMVTGRQVRCPHSPMFEDRSTVLDSAAFAFMRKHPADVRPHMLELSASAYRRVSDIRDITNALSFVEKQNTSEFAAVIRYFRNYLHVYCERENLHVDETARERVIADAMNSWLFGSLAPTQKEYAKSAGMRKQNYARLSGIANSALRKRYQEARLSYAHVMTGTRNEASGVTWNRKGKNQATAKSVGSLETSAEQSPTEYAEDISHAPEEALCFNRGFINAIAQHAGSMPAGV